MFIVVTTDTHTVLTEHITQRRKTDAKYKISGDGIHPNAQGHLIMAAALIKGLNGPKVVGTSAEDLKNLLKSDFFKLVDIRRKL